MTRAAPRTIRYTITPCVLGRLLVAATERGICAVSLSGGDAAVRSFLADEFPGAALRRDDAGLREWAGAVARLLDGAPARPRLPIDVDATAFQRRVWEELDKIPPGETHSYSEIARAIGQPTAARAVARACATNPVAVVIPCHRAVRADGSLSGYRWGLSRKHALLERERTRQRASRRE